MKRILKWAGIVLLSALLLGSIGFVIWAEAAAGPGPAALAALKSDDSVAVSEHNGIVIFQPAKFQATTGFIFYPGGRVEYRSYAPILHKIAAEGYFVALVPVRLNLAFFDIEAGAPVLKDFPQIQFWVTGGHSLGGVASALFAEKHPEIRGIVFWASYPANDGLKNSGIKAISIYGTQDGGLDHGAKIDQNKPLEPADTQFVVIEGANHAQFGDYGPQSGDNPATISAELQWEQAARATAQFLGLFGK